MGGHWKCWGSDPRPDYECPVPLLWNPEVLCMEDACHVLVSCQRTCLKRETKLVVFRRRKETSNVLDHEDFGLCRQDDAVIFLPETVPMVLCISLPESGKALAWRTANHHRCLRHIARTYGRDVNGTHCRRRKV